MWAVKIPRVVGGGIGPRTERCLNWDGPVAMVPSLQHGNISTKRKLRVWRDQKCNPLVGAITPLICADRQNTACRERRYRAQNGKLRKLGLTYRHGTMFAPRKYTERKLRAWRDQKCIQLVGAITPLIFAGRQNTPSRGRRYRAQNGKLRKLGRIYRHGTVFSPKKYIKRKLWAWRDQKCIPLRGAITALTCARRQNIQSRLIRYRAKTGKLRKLDGPIAMVPCLHKGNIYTKRKLQV